MERALILSGGGGRGAFQVGVLKFLEETGWKPDLICGSSVGAINAVGLGSGMTPDQLARIWRTYDRRMLTKLTPKNFILSFFSGRKFDPLMETERLRAMLTEHVNEDALRKSKTEIIITAINIATSQLTYFNHRVITVDHVMASSAIPMAFPWQYIDGEPYWDSGLIANTPVMPALERGVKEIVAVLLSPVGSVKQLKQPKTHHQVAEFILEHFLIGSYNVAVSSAFAQGVKITTVAPTRMLGLRSILNFSPKQAERLIEEGYDSARRQLRNLKP